MFSLFRVELQDGVSVPGPHYQITYAHRDEFVPGRAPTRSNLLPQER